VLGVTALVALLLPSGRAVKAAPPAVAATDAAPSATAASVESAAVAATAS
jgi:hypothetical protein